MMKTKDEIYSSESVHESSSQARQRAQKDKSNRQPVGASGSNRGTDEVLRRLDELWINDDETRLFEEEIISNLQTQQDELLALEAIYGENIVILNRKGGLLLFQIHVPYDFPDGQTVSIKLQSSYETLETGLKGQIGMAENDDSNEIMYKFRVQYLPPIVLTCLLPQSYPSREPPHYIISGQWLDTHKISIICHMLDTIWSEQPGHEVIYLWIEWIHSSALSYLGFENDIIAVGPYGMQESDDRRAISGNVTPDVAIPSLIDYNLKRCHEAFLNTPQQCSICFGDHAGTYFIKLQCQHFFCQKCMAAYCTMHVKEGSVTKLLCPDAKCGEVVPPSILKQVLADDDFNRWESLLLQKTLDMMSDVIYCPRCETACLEDEEHHVQCQKCYFSFCSNCKEARHVGSRCVLLEEKLEILQKTLRTSAHHKERDLMNELLSIMKVRHDSKQCPTCKMAICRTGGCNQMVCTNCYQMFCYDCNEPITGYEHHKHKLIILGTNAQIVDEKIRRLEKIITSAAARAITISAPSA